MAMDWASRLNSDELPEGYITNVAAAKLVGVNHWTMAQAVKRGEIQTKTYGSNGFLALCKTSVLKWMDLRLLPSTLVLKEIPGFPGFSASECGKVVSTRLPNKPRIIKQSRRGHGKWLYMRASIKNKDGTKYPMRASVAVWTAFRGDIPRSQQIAFVDDDTNSSLSNLKLVPKKIDGKLEQYEVDLIREMAQSHSLKEVAKEFSVTIGTVYLIKSGKR